MRKALTQERVFEMQQTARHWDFGCCQSSSFREPARDAWSKMLASLTPYDFEALCQAWLDANSK